ncbi:MAG: hypothetical protein IT577_11865 [Verrucomicrobiae bacterium]|nr:hypothetical protein [Verrucomicrobiae bacterium]
MKKQPMVAVAAGLALSVTAAAQTTIDAFDTWQFMEVPCCPCATNWSSQAAPGAVGGERELYVYRETGAMDSLFGDVALTFPNTVSLSCGPGVRACLHLVYDGPDNSRAVDFAGLGGLDLTEGGTRNAFKFATTSDLGADVEIYVYQDATRYSVAEIPIAADSSFAFVDTVVGFSQFVAAGPAGGADFTRVGAIEFELCNGPEGADISMGVITTVDDPRFGDGCPRTQGYWKNHPDAWPVDALALGAVTYSMDQLLALLGRPTCGDPSMILAHQLIAAKLNIANGCDPTAIQHAVAIADALLATFPGDLPFKVGKRDPRRAMMIAVAAALDAYNNGGE